MIGPLALSKTIWSGSGVIEVALAAEMSVATTVSCAVDGFDPTDVDEAVNTPANGGPSAADRHIYRRAGPGRKALDIAKNLIR